MTDTIWMTIKEVAKEFNLKVSYIYKLTHRRQIPYYKVGNQLRFKRDELMGWFEALRVDPVAVERR